MYDTAVWSGQIPAIDGSSNASKLNNAGTMIVQFPRRAYPMLELDSPMQYSTVLMYWVWCDMLGVRYVKTRYVKEAD